MTHPFNSRSSALTRFRVDGLGTAPTQSILGVLFRDIYNHIIIIIQLLLRGGSTQLMVKDFPRYPGIQIMPTLILKVCKYLDP